MSTEESLLAPARRQAKELSAAQQCIVHIYLGVRNGAPAAWVLPHSKGAPKNGDYDPVRHETWDRGYPAGGLVSATVGNLMGVA